MSRCLLMLLKSTQIHIYTHTHTHTYNNCRENKNNNNINKRKRLEKHFSRSLILAAVILALLTWYNFSFLLHVVFVCVCAKNLIEYGGTVSCLLLFFLLFFKRSLCQINLSEITDSCSHLTICYSSDSNIESDNIFSSCCDKNETYTHTNKFRV